MNGNQQRVYFRNAIKVDPIESISLSEESYIGDKVKNTKGEKKYDLVIVQD